VTDYESYCSFAVRGSLCSVPVTRVREIVCDQPITPVPLSHETVRGLINLRGQILSVLDLGEMMGIAADEGVKSQARYHVVVELEDESISLLVDEMGPVVTPQASQIETPPGNLQASIAGLIESVARLSEDLIFILDIQKVMQSSVTPSPRSHQREI
jgi:purine-binding chemotaxis protein CheW